AVALLSPVAIVSGVVGELFRPFAITVAVALGASLLVSMTIVPVLAYWFLRGGRNQQPAAQTAGDGDGAAPGGGRARPREETHPAGEPRVPRLARASLPILRFGLRQPLITLGAALVVF